MERLRATPLLDCVAKATERVHRLPRFTSPIDTCATSPPKISELECPRTAMLALDSNAGVGTGPQGRAVSTSSAVPGHEVVKRDVVFRSDTPTSVALVHPDKVLAIAVVTWLARPSVVYWDSS